MRHRWTMPTLFLAAITTSFAGGCARERALSITNTADQPVELRWTAEGGEHRVTLGPGGSITTPATRLNFDGVVVESR